MNSNITIEKLDKILERIPYATYAEAKEALTKCDGDVVEAIIFLEAKNNTSKIFSKDTEELKEDFNEIKSQLKELLKKSSVIRIIIEKNSKVIINIPLTLGVVGFALGPLYALVGLSAAMLGKYQIKVQNEEDGVVVDLGELSEEKLNILKQMLTNTVKDVKDSVMDKKKNDTDNKDITDELMKEFEDLKENEKEDK